MRICKVYTKPEHPRHDSLERSLLHYYAAMQSSQMTNIFLVSDLRNFTTLIIDITEIAKPAGTLIATCFNKFLNQEIR